MTGEPKVNHISSYNRPLNHSYRFHGFIELRHIISTYASQVTGDITAPLSEAHITQAIIKNLLCPEKSYENITLDA